MPELAQALRHSDRIHDRAAIDDAIARMAAEIGSDCAGERLLMLTVMHGGMFFAAELALALGAKGSFDMDFDYLHATRYRGATTGAGLEWKHRPASSLQGRHVLIADDILDEGHTLAAIRDWCREQDAASIRIAVLAWKRHGRGVPDMAADYVGVEVPDRYVYGFGMDFHEQGRNLPAIYALRDQPMSLREEAGVALAVIGGTGLYRLAALSDEKALAAATPYGMASGPVRVGALGGRRVAFLARHGEGHSLPPHKVNYRANLWLLKEIGATRVLAVNAVGGITERYGPRAIGVPDQIIDYTWGRIATFCEEDGAQVLHVDMTEPYTPSLRAALLAAADVAKVDVVDGGCYGATQGPRLETKAEIERLRRDGCDLVGMTGMPEAGLARELGLQYASIALVANWAAGCGAAQAVAEITMDEVHANLDHATVQLPALIASLLEGIDPHA